jgi:SAM-dependent methyltransferase
MAEATGGPQFKDHFSQRSADYAANRPSYPPELAAFLAENSPNRRMALDCGCGTGQLSILLADHFDAVIATDASAQQIAAATPHPGISYRVAPAEASGLDPASADLIVAAQAAHWFDIEAFYAEARRVSTPGALLALVTYGVFHVEGDAEAALQHFYWKTIAPYWPPERRHVEERYQSLPFPFPEIAVPHMAIERHWTREDMLGYVDTWSAVRAAEKSLGHSPLDALRGELEKIWPDGASCRISWPLAIRAGHLPG